MTARKLAVTVIRRHMLVPVQVRMTARKLAVTAIHGYAQRAGTGDNDRSEASRYSNQGQVRQLRSSLHAHLLHACHTRVRTCLRRMSSEAGRAKCARMYSACTRTK